jgi:hypothetical protein
LATAGNEGRGEAEHATDLRDPRGLSICGNRNKHQWTSYLLGSGGAAPSAAETLFGRREVEQPPRVERSAAGHQGPAPRDRRDKDKALIRVIIVQLTQ